jgi:hypothetical protein
MRLSDSDVLEAFANSGTRRGKLVMGGRVFITVSGTVVMVVLGGLVLSQTTSAQREIAEDRTVRRPIYNPYPSGVLPSDLQSEIARVEREVDNIFQQTLKQWRATPPPTVAGNPPTLQGSGMRLVQILGKLELFDDEGGTRPRPTASRCQSRRHRISTCG